MKKLTFILVAMFLGVSFISAQETAKARFVEATSETEAVFNFGNIQEELGKAVHEFKFTNTGNAPLLIKNLQASCGCTTPSYTGEPVLPGKSGVITVQYSTTNRVGAINKTVTVTTNGEPAVYYLKITGQVLPKKAN